MYIRRGGARRGGTKCRTRGSERRKRRFETRRPFLTFRRLNALIPRVGCATLSHNLQENPMKPLRRLSLAVVAVFLLAPLAARAQVLQQVPADAAVVIKVNKLKATSDKIAAFAQKIGITDFVPQMKDPLGQFLNRPGMSRGVDPDGEMAIVLLNEVVAAGAVDADAGAGAGVGRGRGGRPKPPVMALVPVTDYKAFLGNYPGARTEGDVSVVKVKGDPGDTYVMQWGNYAAISDSKARVAKPAKQGITPAGNAAKEMNERDICAYANLAGARDKILAQMKSSRASMLNEFE